MRFVDVYAPRGKPGSIVGCDMSGTVVKLGKNVSNFKLGDHVVTTRHGSAYPDEGAFAEYAKAPADLLWAVPEDTLTFEESATFNVAYVHRHLRLMKKVVLIILCRFLTPVQMFYHPKHLDLVEPPDTVQGEQWILIYGGSCECSVLELLPSV